MENKAHERYKWICLQIEEDGEMVFLREKLRLATPEFMEAMHALPPALREDVTEYLGILGEISARTTEICCYMP